MFMHQSRWMISRWMYKQWFFEYWPTEVLKTCQGWYNGTVFFVFNMVGNDVFCVWPCVCIWKFLFDWQQLDLLKGKWLNISRYTYLKEKATIITGVIVISLSVWNNNDSKPDVRPVKRKKKKFQEILQGFSFWRKKKKEFCWGNFFLPQKENRKKNFVLFLFTWSMLFLLFFCKWVTKVTLFCVHFFNCYSAQKTIVQFLL